MSGAPPEKDRKRVLISAYACEPGKGSEPSVGWNVALAMAEHHDVWVLTRSNNRPAIDQALTVNHVRNLSFIYVDLPHWATFWKRGGRGIQIYYYLWQLAILSAARDLHREIRFDLAHHLTFGQYWSPSLLVELPIPLVWGPLGGGESAPRPFWRDFSRQGRVYETLRDLVRRLRERDPLVRRTARHSAIALASTPDTARALKRIGVSNPRILLQMGIHPLGEIAPEERARPNENEVRFITIGRLIHWKGVHLGLRAFARAKLSGEYWIIGDGPERASLESLAVDLSISDRVRFFGALTRDETLGHLAAADVLVHPSLHDQSPAVICEAMAVGRPVICLDLGGPALQVTDDVGIRVRAIDPEQTTRDLASAMEELAADGSRRRSMGQRAKVYAYDEFSWSNKAVALDRIYRDALAPKTN